MKKHSDAPVMNDDRTLRITGEILTENIPFAPFGRQAAETIFDIMLRAAAGADSIENTCKTLQDAPSGKTVRTHLEQYGSVTDMEVHMNRALQARLPPPRVRDNRQPLAVDYNKLPYYGDPSYEEMPYVCKGKAESGTTRFYVYATLYVIRKGKRVTVALIIVRPDDTYVAVITRLLDKIASLNIKIKCLYADKGFFNVPVIRWLKALGITFVIPVVIRGEKGGPVSLSEIRKLGKQLIPWKAPNTAPSPSMYGLCVFTATGDTENTVPKRLHMPSIISISASEVFLKIIENVSALRRVTVLKICAG
ncbi:MAG: transposase [bacterium]|nr:transposase [bacterium]